MSQTRISYTHSELEVFAYMGILDIRCIEISAYDERGGSPPQIQESLCWLVLKYLIAQVWKTVTL